MANKIYAVIADIIEGSDDAMVVAEAPEKHRLAELTMQDLSSAEAMVGEVQLLPAKKGITREVA